MTDEQRKAVIAALLKKDLDSIKEAKGEIFVIRNFFDHLKFSQTIGRTLEDFDKVVIAPGEYRTLLEKLNKNGDGVSPFPIWWVPVDTLSDEETEEFKDGKDKL